MGGKHKKSIAQMEKQQMLSRLRALKGKKKSEVVERTVRNVLVTDNLISEIRDDVSKIRYITPSTIALKYNLRLSIARDILEKLESEGRIMRVSKNRRLAIYKPIAAS